jgi:hypothetical protein
MMEQEVLPPQRRPDGRFAPGWEGGPGRAGKANLTTKQARQMILEALEMVGGAQYLATIAIINPPAFCQLVGRTLPLKVEGDPDAPVFTIIERRIVDPEK